MIGRTRKASLPGTMWSEGPETEANKIHLQNGRGYHSRILQAADPTLPSRTCWHVGADFKRQVELPRAATGTASRGVTGQAWSDLGLGRVDILGHRSLLGDDGSAS